MAKLICITNQIHKVPQWVNPDHIVLAWEEDGLTRLELSNGKIIYPAESPAEIADLMRRV